MPLKQNKGYNTWIIKPTFLNRGKGLRIFNNLNKLK